MEMLMLLVGVKMLGIGRMELRGRMGHRLAQDEKRRMLSRQMLVTRWVLVRETGWVIVVQRMGRSRDRRLGESRADPPPPEPDNPIQATAANEAGLPEGAAIARRQHLRREATAPIEFCRRGTIRAVSGGSRLIRCNAKASGRKL